MVVSSALATTTIDNMDIEVDCGFRVWDVKHKAWLSSGLFLNHRNVLFEYVDNYGGTFSSMVMERVEWEHVVCKASGLRDKNKNMMYEGDIVRVHRLRYPDRREDFQWYDCVEVGQIKFLNMRFVEDFEHIRYDDIFDLVAGTSHRYEVIGNIYENPELLKTRLSS